jgi:hypothetical protein
MSRRTPERVPETDMTATTSESYASSNPVSVEDAAGPPTAARIQAIHDLVRTNGYDVSAMLVAERIVERALAGKRDHRD